MPSVRTRTCSVREVEEIARRWASPSSAFTNSPQSRVRDPRHKAYSCCSLDMDVVWIFQPHSCFHLSIDYSLSTPRTQFYNMAGTFSMCLAGKLGYEDWRLGYEDWLGYENWTVSFLTHLNCAICKIYRILCDLFLNIWLWIKTL